MKLVYIEWCDAVASGLDWSTIDIAEEWADKTEWVVKECGWIVKETKEYIAIASAWKTEDEYTEEQFKHLMKIPKTWILKRIDLSKYVRV